LLILLLAVLNTFVYFEQARVVAAAFSSPEQRTQLFAQMDLAVSVLTLFTQAVLTNVLIARFGVGGLLSGLLLLNVGGFAALGMAPVLSMLVVFQVLRRASDYAIIRPVREILFTVVSREEKYKAKNFIDTVVFRGGDAAAGWLVSAIQALGATTGHVALLATPLAGLAAGVAWRLGQKQEALRRSSAAPQAVGLKREAAD
jgi:AAA family ATP:ADP antiporter